MKCSIEFAMSLESYVHILPPKSAKNILDYLVTKLLMGGNTNSEEPEQPFDDNEQFAWALLTELLREQGVNVNGWDEDAKGV